MASNHPERSQYNVDRKKLEEGLKKIDWSKKGKKDKETKDANKKTKS